MKTYQGTVLKANGQKTLSVLVSRSWAHPKYQKIVRSTRKYLVHDATNQAQVGQAITFKESRPYSKRKRFALIT